MTSRVSPLDDGPNFKLPSSRSTGGGKKNIESRWRAKVVRRDGGRCRACGYRGLHVSAHHVIFKSHCEQPYRLDERNGITLCNEFARPKGKGCHQLLHGGRLKLTRGMLPSSVIECLAEQGLIWGDDGNPRGTLSTYFA